MSANDKQLTYRYGFLRLAWITWHPARKAAYEALAREQGAWHPFDVSVDTSTRTHFADPAAHLRAAHEVAARVDAAQAALADVEADLGTRFDVAARAIGFPGAPPTSAPRAAVADGVVDALDAWNEPRRDAALNGLDGAATCVSECRSLVRRGFVGAADALLEGAERNLAEVRLAFGVRE